MTSSKSMADGDVQNMSSGSKLSTFVMMNLALFVSYALYSLPGAFLPLYNLDRDISSAVTGLMLSAVPLCYIIVCPIAGKLLDKYSAKTMLLISTGALAVVTYLCATLGSISSNTTFIILIILLRLCQGAAGGVIDVIAFAITTKMYPNNVALTTAVIETSLNLAVAVAPYLGGVLYQTGGYYLSFVVTATAILGVLIAAVPGVKNVNTRRDTAGGNLKHVISQFLVIFPAWHSAACMILFNFYIPILSPYVQAAFNEGAAFAGFALLINTAGICLAAPILGHLMDKLNPYAFFLASGFLLPATYIFLGPAPFLQTAGVAASKAQLCGVLAVIGVMVPTGCYPALLIMYDVYKVRFGEMPQAAQNYMTSIYCASFPLGGFIGSAISGIIAEYYSFAFSTMVIAFVFLVETVFVCVFCLLVWKEKRGGKGEESAPLLGRTKDSGLGSSKIDSEANSASL